MPKHSEKQPVKELCKCRHTCTSIIPLRWNRWTGSLVQRF